MTEMMQETMESLRREVDALNYAPAAQPLPAEPDPAAEIWPLGIKPGGEAARDMERQALESENAELRARVADLEDANRRLAAEVDAARAEGERTATEYAARTHHGRVPSLFLGR